MSIHIQTPWTRFLEGGERSELEFTIGAPSMYNHGAFCKVTICCLTPPLDLQGRLL